MTTKELVTKVIGLTVLEAASLCEKHNTKLRLASEDSLPFVLTRDYQTDRINLHIVDKKITRATIG